MPMPRLFALLFTSAILLPGLFNPSFIFIFAISMLVFRFAPLSTSVIFVPMFELSVLLSLSG